MRCYAEGDVHDFPIKDEAGAHCPEHGVTLLWRGDSITAADASGGAGADLGGLWAEVGGPFGVACRSALVTDLAGVHALCRRPDCVCPCHSPPPTAVRDVV